MLIEKSLPPKAQDVVAIRLLTGEEIVGKMVVISATTITISKPVVLQMQMVAPNQAGIAFAPLMMAIDPEQPITIALDKLLTPPMKARSEIVNNYTRATTSLITGGTVGLNL